MPDTGLSASDIQHIKHALSQYPDVQEVILFGSRAKGCYKKGSDIDLAIRFSHPEHSSIQLIHDALEEDTPLPYFFDVIDIETIQNPDLRKHIERVGLTLNDL